MTDVASYSYDSSKRELVSYDTPQCATTKAEYIMYRGLGGAMWWEASGDLPITNSDSLILTVTNTMKNLDTSDNWLWYPNSTYQNMADGMPSS